MTCTSRLCHSYTSLQAILGIKPGFKEHLSVQLQEFNELNSKLTYFLTTG